MSSGQRVHHAPSGLSYTGPRASSSTIPSYARTVRSANCTISSTVRFVKRASSGPTSSTAVSSSLKGVATRPCLPSTISTQALRLSTRSRIIKSASMVTPRIASADPMCLPISDTTVRKLVWARSPAWRMYSLRSSGKARATSMSMRSRNPSNRSTAAMVRATSSVAASCRSEISEAPSVTNSSSLSPCSCSSAASAAAPSPSPPLKARPMRRWSCSLKSTCRPRRQIG
mmetsp:Transcript_64780/g.146128  ORF Transcript_64780/g.146128 Transcript_64780/m.146128 type:complete len:229 (+) Transcript_64780:1289-1975(+)